MAALCRYIETLDGFMQQAVIDAKTVNNFQIIILAIEGACGAGPMPPTHPYPSRHLMISVLTRRFLLMSVFIVLPHGLIRALATRAFDLGEEEEVR